MKKVYVFLVDGFEEVEAVTPVDLMRRAGLEVTTVGLEGLTVTGAHGITLQADMDGRAFALPGDAGAVVLPGGPGTDTLMQSAVVAGVLAEAQQRGIVIAAICAAPGVLHKAGLLAGKRATAFPAVQAQLTGAQVTGAAVERDGNIITGRAAGVAVQFGHALIEALCGRPKADEVVAGIYPETV